MAYMHCPRCKEVELKITKIKDIEIDYCPKCFGIWLDRGEMNHIIERLKIKSSKHSEENKYDTEPKTKAVKNRKKQKEGSFLEDVLEFFEDYADDSLDFDWD
jgi:Zn-finger nucleic acid-binding protein